MIRFENLYINRKEKILNECFDEGTKFIDNESQFNFLKLKKEPKSGFAYIDGIKVSYDGTGEKGFFVLDINSKIFCLSAVFMKEDNFDEIKKEILDELSCLKELPLDDENQKCRKINLILSILTKYYCSYCLIDFNNPINYQNKNLILKCLGHFDQKTVFIVLDKKNDFANKSNQIDEQVNIKNKATLKVGFKQFFEFIKVNILQLLFLTIESAICVFLSFLCPYYFQNGEIALAVTTLICFIFLFIFILYFSCSIFSLSKKSTLRLGRTFKISHFYLSSLLFLIIGIICSFVVFFVLKSNNILIKSEEYNYFMIVLPSTVSAALLIAPFVISPLSKLIEVFKNKNKNIN